LTETCLVSPFLAAATKAKDFHQVLNAAVAVGRVAVRRASLFAVVFAYRESLAEHMENL